MKSGVSEWINQINDSENSNSDIIAFNFGLIEKDDGYGICLNGSTE